MNIHKDATLLDWFAATVLASYDLRIGYNDPEYWEKVAKAAYGHADAMLKERDEMRSKEPA